MRRLTLLPLSYILLHLFLCTQAVFLQPSSAQRFSDEETDRERIDPDSRSRDTEANVRSPALRKAEAMRTQLLSQLESVNKRIVLLRRRQQLEDEKKQDEQQSKDSTEDSTEQGEKEKRRFLIELELEQVSLKLELLDKQDELLELQQAFANENIQSEERFFKELRNILAKATKLIDQFFVTASKSDDRRTEEIEFELGELEQSYAIRSELLGLKLELHFAREEGDASWIEELELELHDLSQEVGQRSNPVNRFNSEQKGQSLQPRKPLSVDTRIVLAAESLNYKQHIEPVLKRHCHECHSTESASGDLDLESLAKQKPWVTNRKVWRNINQQVRMRTMPPPESAPMPDADRLIVAGFLQHEIDHFDYQSVRQPGYEPARRLTNAEYNHTIRDLFGIDLRPADRFPRELTASSGFANSSNSLFLQPVILERYLRAAEQVVQTAMPLNAEIKQSEKTRDLLVGSGSLVEVIANFAKRAFRRPVLEEELKPLLNYYTELTGKNVETVKHSEISYHALGKVYEVILTSPSFLFRSESVPNVDEGVAFQITDHELASRLSYFLWASMPDLQLRQTADDGTLSRPDVLHVQVNRMLADPKARTLGEIFAAQWLGFSALPHVPRDPIDNPWATDSLVAAMQKESALFFSSLVTDNQPIERLLDANYTFVNEELAQHYDLGKVFGSEMRRVSLERTPRSGILGHGSILAITSFPGRTSPVVRGNWILSELLGTPPPPPPPNVSEFDERVARRDHLSQRQKLELHRDHPNCYTCHAQIDPLGFALEHYDWFGRFRHATNGREPDVRGSLPDGEQFQGLSGLQAALLEERRDQLVEQITRKMFTYALGRQLEYFDESVIKETIEKLEADNRKIKTLIHAIVESDTFQKKQLTRGEKMATTVSAISQKPHIPIRRHE